METSKSFGEFKLKPALLKAIGEMGFHRPTEIQTMVVPIALACKDVIVQAQTGTGKTAAFGIPILEKLLPSERGVQALVLTPTRELAVQVAADLGKLGRHLGLRTVPIYGGQTVEAQKKVLSQRIHVIVGTPGRILDHIESNNIELSNIRTLVLDEADEMLNLGLIEEVRAILNYLPSQRQTMLFSATITETAKELAKQYTFEPQYIYATPQQLISKNISQFCYRTVEANKEQLLLGLLQNNEIWSMLVFCHTRKKVEHITRLLNSAGYAALELRGDLPQKQRLEVLSRFKKGQCKFLIATDVAARGLDISGVSLVVNYDIPQHPEVYIHRVGRTGRANNTGSAIVFYTEEEAGYLEKIESYTGASLLLVDEDALSILPSSKDGKVTPPAEYGGDQPQKPRDIMRLFIGAGRKNKLRAGDIVGAITGTGIAADKIGVIEIYDTYCFVDVLEGEGEAVLQKLQNSLIKGRRVKVDKAL